MDATVVANSVGELADAGMLPLRMRASKNWRSEGYIQFPDVWSWPVSFSPLDGVPCDGTADAAYGDGHAAGVSDDCDPGSRARGIVLTSRSEERGRCDFARGLSVSESAEGG